MWARRRRCSAAPLGLEILKRRKSAETAAEMEFGFSGVPSGWTKIKSRSAR